MHVKAEMAISRRTIIGLLWVLSLAMPLSACDRSPPWQTKNISGLMPKLSFSLTEANRDKPVHASDYHGEYLMVYFGYTNCPDVCPLTLTRLGHVLAKLGAAAQQVRILFVTVDPKRDTLSILKRYSAFFGPQVLGLRGDQAALRKLTKRYRVTYGYEKPDANGNYEVSHSSAVYVFDKSGAARLLIRPTDSISAVVTDMKRMMTKDGGKR